MLTFHAYLLIHSYHSCHHTQLIGDFDKFLSNVHPHLSSNLLLLWQLFNWAGVWQSCFVLAKHLSWTQYFFLFCLHSVKHPQICWDFLDLHLWRSRQLHLTRSHFGWELWNITLGHSPCNFLPLSEWAALVCSQWLANFYPFILCQICS